MRKVIDVVQKMCCAAHNYIFLTEKIEVESKKW